MLSFLSRPAERRAADFGAGDGNRTRIASLEGWSSTIELHPPIRHPRATTVQSIGGGGRIRTYVGRSQQVYSLPPLATRAPLRAPIDSARSGSAQYGHLPFGVNLKTHEKLRSRRFRFRREWSCGNTQFQAGI